MCTNPNAGRPLDGAFRGPTRSSRNAQIGVILMKLYVATRGGKKAVRPKVERIPDTLRWEYGGGKGARGLSFLAYLQTDLRPTDTMGHWAKLLSSGRVPMNERHMKCP